MGVAGLAVLLLAGAKSAVPAPAVAPAPKPTLKVDSTPVTDGKSPLVASYADVVAPVQKAVVSVYSA